MIYPFHRGGCHDTCCLKVHNVSVKIGGDKILKNVNLHVHCGQMVALIGPNGAGKSTRLRTLLGEREYDGNIIFSAPGTRRAKARIGYVPQSPNFDPGDPVSVADLFTCCLSRRPAFLGAFKSDREMILECLDRVHGEDLIDKRVGTLSGVDIEGQTGLMDMLDEIRREYDLSILMTTHDFSMLDRYADRVVLIDHEVKCQGTPGEVLASPEFRAAFHMKEAGK